VLAVLGVVLPAHAGEIFTATTPSQAREAAGEDRLSIVFLTDPDDPDATFMEREAWTHPQVAGWVSEHAVATRVGARSFLGARLRTSYRLERLPAILAFQGDSLLRQHQGALDGPALAAWLEVARSGDVALANLVTQAAPTRAVPQEIDLDARLMAAIDAENPAAAAVALLQVWTETVGTPQQDARRERVLDALAPRVDADPTAHERTVAARDAAWHRYRKGESLPDLLDWMALNRVLEEDTATATWVGETARSKDRDVLHDVLTHPEDPLLPMLVETGRWPNLGMAIADPVALMDARLATYKKTKITITGAESSVDREAHRRGQAALVAALLAADREREARQAADHLLTLDRKAGPLIVDVALEAREPRRWMRRLLDPSRAEQVELAMRLTQAVQGI